MKTNQLHKDIWSSDMYIDPEPIYRHFNAVKVWQQENVDEKINLYKKALISNLVKKMKFSCNDEIHYQLSMSLLTKDVGMQRVFGANSNPKHFATEIYQYQNLFVCEDDMKGNNLKEKISLVKLNFNLLNAIKTRNAIDLIQIYEGIDLNDKNLVEMTPIDMDSLRAFIKDNEQQTKRSKKVIANHEMANYIQLIAEQFDGQLPQIINKSHFGRHYHKGPSLQSVSKLVRHAALGDCYEYDLNSSVYSIKFATVSLMDPTKHFPRTAELVADSGKTKDYIRERLVKKCFNLTPKDNFYKDRLNVIKQAMTAIGFGATKTTSAYFDDTTKTWEHSSLYNCFTYEYKNKRYRHKFTVGKIDVYSFDEFMNDDYIKKFIQEQKEINKIIVNFLITEKEITKEDNHYLLDGRNAWNTNKIIAFWFQTIEKRIADEFVDFAEQLGINVLLRVHDAIYLDKPINPTHLSVFHDHINEKYVSDEVIRRSGNRILTFTEEKHNRFVEQMPIDDESDIDINFSKLINQYVY